MSARAAAVLAPRGKGSSAANQLANAHQLQLKRELDCRVLSHPPHVHLHAGPDRNLMASVNLAQQQEEEEEEESILQVNRVGQASEIPLLSAHDINRCEEDIALALDNGTPGRPLTFHVLPADLPTLQSYTSVLRITRLYYNHATERAILTMGESPLHYHCQEALANLIDKSKDDLAILAVAAKLRRIYSNGSVEIGCDRFVAQPDLSFIDDESILPSLVGEIAYSQTTQDVEAKAMSYIADSQGEIRAVFILDIEYPEAEVATVSLLTAHQDDDNNNNNNNNNNNIVNGGNDDADSAADVGFVTFEWAFRRQVVFDNKAAIQPEGAIHLFASDFLTPSYSAVPPALARRRSADDSDCVGGSTDGRSYHATITYEQIRNIMAIARRRHLQQRRRTSISASLRAQFLGNGTGSTVV
ncbi:hypothetical protein EsH8_XV_000023 [Colletotrichum jinshuiense]